uniref:Uncharacterized protein n=1 Tax=Physcomitrium patens TaxID=3218 RepID=A0A2K1J8K7_PHYPA|nr:hypothetical protein PHYPA_020965 [Physcomitrium patens]
MFRRCRPRVGARKREGGEHSSRDTSAALERSLVGSDERGVLIWHPACRKSGIHLLFNGKLGTRPSVGPCCTDYVETDFQ